MISYACFNHKRELVDTVTRQHLVDTFDAIVIKKQQNIPIHVPFEISPACDTVQLVIASSLGSVIDDFFDTSMTHQPNKPQLFRNTPFILHIKRAENPLKK
jgi:hypothetical protein